MTAGETDLAHAAAERWWRGRGRGEPRRRRLAALARHLERAGFNAAAVAEQLRRFEAAGELEGEFDQDLDDGSKLL